MSAIAHEMSRRMTPEYAKERAREMARQRAYEARYRAAESSWFIPVVSAGIGALVGKALQGRAQERYGRSEWEEERYGRGYGYRPYGYERGWDEERRAYGYGYGAIPEEGRGYGAFDHGDLGESSGTEEQGGLKQKASDTASRFGERASEVKERASAKAEEVTGRVRERASQFRERMPDSDRLRRSAYEDTGLWAFGAMALGALFGFALPVTEREREFMEPARRKLQEATQQAKEMALEKGSQAMDRASAKVEGREEHEEEESRGVSPIVTPSGDQPPPLH